MEKKKYVPIILSLILVYIGYESKSRTLLAAGISGLLFSVLYLVFETKFQLLIIEAKEEIKRTRHEKWGLIDVIFIVVLVVLSIASLFMARHSEFGALLSLLLYAIYFILFFIYWAIDHFKKKSKRKRK